MNNKKGNTKTLFKYLLQKKTSIFWFLLSILLMSVAVPLKSYALQWLIESKTWAEAIHLLLLSIFVVLVSHISEYFSGRIFVRSSSLAITLVRQDLMKKYAEMSLNDYFSEHTGNRLSLLTNDLKMISDNYYQSIFNLVMWGGILLVATIMMILISPYILVITLLLSMIPFFVPKIIQKTIGKYRKDYSSQIAEYTTKTDELLRGYETLVTGGAIKYFLEMHQSQSSKVFHSDYNLQKGMKLASVLTSFAAWLPSLGILSAGIYLVFIGQITIGYLVTANSLSSFILGPIRILSSSYVNLKSCNDIKEHIEEVLNQRVIEDATKESHSINKIIIDNLSYSYPGAETETIKNLSICITEGEKIAIVGESGSGKSTIAKLLFRYDTDYRGSIQIDENEIRELNASSLYRYVSMIPQFPFLFSDTIRNNICLGKSYTPEQLEEAITIAKLEPFLKTLPNGIDTLLSEGGGNLSGGQIQRIAIARAIIRKSSLIIVDEATSNLDPVITAEVMNDFLDMPGTVIIVTHDIFGKYMDRFDKVIYIKDGQISAAGKFQEMLNTNTEFTTFYEKGISSSDN